jgi:hypothetical protein
MGEATATRWHGSGGVLITPLEPNQVPTLAQAGIGIPEASPPRLIAILMAPEPAQIQAGSIFEGRNAAALAR